MMGKDAGVHMTINGIELNISMAAYDGCHKIYIPVKGQEELFVRLLESKGWIWEEDFFKIESVEDLQNMYLYSCSLRFIQQIDCSGNEERFINIIPQCSFYNREGFFNEKRARKAFKPKLVGG